MEPPVNVPEMEEDSEGSITSSESTPAPNTRKFQGSQSTWRQLTQEERLISTSLIRLRDQDLSVHLYNAHAMRYRYYISNVISERKLDPWARKDTWWGNEGSATNDEDKVFVSPRSWTAWPLPADVVPRTGEHIGPIDEDEEYTLKRPEVTRPSRELEDVLTGTTLRLAKDEFEEREWESLRPEPDERALHRDGSITRPSQEDLDMPDEPGHEDERFARASSQQPPENDAKFQLPIVSADEERSRELLSPTIRHTLSKLDELLMGLHHARQICISYCSERPGSQTQTDADEESGPEEKPQNNLQPQTADSTLPPQSSRKRGRPSKVLTIPDDAKGIVMEELESPSVAKRGRPKKHRIPLPGETHNEMLVRIARLHNQKLPFQSPSNSRPSSSHGKTTNRRAQSISGIETQQKSLARLSLRDWSEVIGTAALVGFSSAVIARATQRCATLFGESIAMHSLVENPVAGEEEDERLLYVPDRIPDLKGDSSEASDSKDSVTRHSVRPLRRRTFRSRSVKPEGNEYTYEAVVLAEPAEKFECSFRGCPRREEAFSKRQDLVSHLKNAHKLEGDELVSALNGSEDEMFGGVHVDGFLKDIKARQGWRGHSSIPRTKIKSPEDNSGEGVLELD